jgi:hypothetical protein
MNLSEKLAAHPIFARVAQVAAKEGLETYVVGGYVRDLILDRPSKDIDFTCVGSGIHLAQEVAKTFEFHVPLSVFKNFGTAMLKLDDWELEFVGARKESYRQDSRKPLVEDGTLQEDLERRDFTINAMAISLNPENYGELIDPFDGSGDLKLGILRTPLDPVVTLMDDPLRILRAMRFSITKGFEIDTKILWAVKQPEILEKLKTVVSAERIREEIYKMMKYDTPATLEMIHRFNLLIPGFSKMIFSRGLWLKPTFEKQ